MESTKYDYEGLEEGGTKIAGPAIGFELFILGDSEKKVAEVPDTRGSLLSPAGVMTVQTKEDHTLGNLMRSQLLKDPRVKFAGYKVPHPLFSKIELRIQTDGEIEPRAALIQACRQLVTDLGTVSREFTKEYELRKMAGEGANGTTGGQQ
ncbi:DNA-directed RNA polymerase II core subunit [Varicellaria rhodocarpa]|nr:DNA-directed RNA polymerase II core subunit [Varicellaria rhodocarpa]